MARTTRARMESFYAGQAALYDDFRRRLLQGRQELWNAIDASADAVWVDMGGGTGANLDYFGDCLTHGKVYVVDLSHSLLHGRSPIRAAGWTIVETKEADATLFQPPESPVDVVTFSYSG